MASDDYCVVVYKILNFLYEGLKKGKPVYCDGIMNDGSIFPRLNSRYWGEIIEKLIDDHYIILNSDKYYADGIELCEIEYYTITVRGIEYMYQNLAWIKTCHEMVDCRIWKCLV